MAVNLEIEMNRLSDFLKDHAPRYSCQKHGVGQTKFFIVVYEDSPANAVVTLTNRVIKAYHVKMNTTSVGKHLCKTLQAYALLHNFAYEGPTWH